MGGEKFKITQDEFKQIGNSKGAVYIKSADSWINMSTVATIYPEKNQNDILDRKQLTTGILHDGTRVIRHFGSWVDASQEVPDDNGNYKKIQLDPEYYPEVALDKVFTEKEYQEIKQLGTEEKLQLLIGNDSRAKRLGENKGFQKLID